VSAVGQIDFEVAIAGGGPVGLVLAIELGQRGVHTLLLNDRTGTSPHPQANATQARTMEHYRRLGFAERVRASGLPADYPTDICYFTRYTAHELARMPLPASRDARMQVRTLGGSWSAAELAHRGSQMFIEPVLLDEARKLPSVHLAYGCRLQGFEQDGKGVKLFIDSCPVGAGPGREVRARWLAGCDGARSTVRRILGAGWTGQTGTRRGFMGGSMLAMYFRCPQLYSLLNRPRAWMYWTFNAGRRSFMAAIDGVERFVFHTQLHADESADEIDDEALRSMFFETLGQRCAIEMLSRSSWVAGHALVAERFARDRVFLAGDAAHLFTPTGGLGYNTGVEDAVNLGWKLAAVARGQASPDLLDSYEAERRPAAIRNTGHANRLADSIGLMSVPEGLEEEGPRGDAVRAQAGQALLAHARAEFNIPGITLGTRYEQSPIIAYESTPAPPDRADHYSPDSLPGGRAPHVWLADGASLYDRFSQNFTLLETVPDAEAPGCLPIRLPANVAHLTFSRSEADAIGLASLYPKRFTLVRPDQVVAWRGDSIPEDCASWLAHVGAMGAVS
jgi:2-polyprenyl-6-methoxyphenol hydroxylase-like FAD-dependent oxidoreductase